MATRNFLYKSEIIINDFVSIKIPTVGEILECEDAYYNLVQLLTAMPIDLMVLLDDAKIDFSTINDYDLFILMFNAIKQCDTKLIFGDLDLSPFEFAIDEQTGKAVYIDPKTERKFDRALQVNIAEALRKMHHLEKNTRKPGNEEAKKYMIERARKKMKRNRRRKQDSQLESLIVAMVNTEQFKYDFAGTLELSIYQFNESVRQITHKINYSNLMFGIYSGSVSSKDINQDDLNWLKHK